MRNSYEANSEEFTGLRRAAILQHGQNLQFEEIQRLEMKGISKRLTELDTEYFRWTTA